MTTCLINRQNETTLSVSFAQPRWTLSLFAVSIYVVLGSFANGGMPMQVQSVWPGELISQIDSHRNSNQVTQPTPASGTNNETPPVSSRTIVIGFVGGRVHPDNAVHREVRIARHLQSLPASNAEVEVFANRQGEAAYKRVLRFLDSNHDGRISPTEKRAARVVIYGHSWGAAQSIVLAQRLERNAIPVLLTAQVDSVAKLGKRDGVFLQTWSKLLITISPMAYFMAVAQFTRSPLPKRGS